MFLPESFFTSSAVLKRSEKLRRMSKQRVLLTLRFEQRSHVSFTKETDELVSRKIFTTVKIYSRTNLTSSAKRTKYRSQPISYVSSVTYKPQCCKKKNDCCRSFCFTTTALLNSQNLFHLATFSQFIY